MQLRQPRPEDQAQIEDMINEFLQADRKTDGFFGNKENFDYQDWLEELALAEVGLGVAKDFVPYIQLVSFDENGLALGFLNLRLALNEKLRKRGGHIGYSIRPSQRGKGYAKEQLRQGLHLAHQKNLPTVLLTCHQANQASRAVILANEGKFQERQGEIEHYLIETH